MVQIPRVSQVPIAEPIYTNGIMNPVWIRFFERLASLMNVSEVADSLDLIQLANQLPTQAVMGQRVLDTAFEPMPFSPVQIPIDSHLAPVVVSQDMPEPMPLINLPVENTVYVTIYQPPEAPISN